jgi:phospholipid transport system transporter-binding protein
MTAKVKIDGSSAVLSGDLIFSTVLSVRAELESAVDKAEQLLVIDFGSVSRVDSSAVSLWLCLQRRSHGRKLELKAQNVPAELSSIARLAGLESLLN